MMYEYAQTGFRNTTGEVFDALAEAYYEVEQTKAKDKKPRRSSLQTSREL